MRDVKSIRSDDAHQDALSAAGEMAISPRPGIRSAYLHIPFCFHKCHYCDFYSIVDRDDRQADFTDRLIREIEVWKSWMSPAMRSIFIGGGTPTLLAAPHWRRLLKRIHNHMPIGPDTEFTVEANPETVTGELLDVLVEGGVNRMSLGAQSFQTNHLETLERWHEVDSVSRAVDLARSAGIVNLNLDLIFAIPGQTLKDWLSDLRAALLLEPTHLSCYALTYEPNTPLYKKAQAGRVEPCEDELEAAMYEATMDTLASAGYGHYEISNWALMPQDSGRKTQVFLCQHNLAYWHNKNWLAFGPSASGHIAGLRWKNIPHLARYLDSIGPAPAQDIEQLDEQRSIGEQLMMRLRLIEGAELHWLQPLLSRKRQELIAELIDQGLLEKTKTHLRLTRPGLLLADSVIGELL